MTNAVQNGSLRPKRLTITTRKGNHNHYNSPKGNPGKHIQGSGWFGGGETAVNPRYYLLFVLVVILHKSVTGWGDGSNSLPLSLPFSFPLPLPFSLLLTLSLPFSLPLTFPFPLSFPFPLPFFLSFPLPLLPFSFPLPLPFPFSFPLPLSFPFSLAFPQFSLPVLGPFPLLFLLSRCTEIVELGSQDVQFLKIEETQKTLHRLLCQKLKFLICLKTITDLSSGKLSSFWRYRTQKDISWSGLHVLDWPCRLLHQKNCYKFHKCLKFV